MANNVPPGGRELMYDEVIATGDVPAESSTAPCDFAAAAPAASASGKLRPSATNSVAGLLRPSRAMRIAVSNRSTPSKRTTTYPACVIAEATEDESAAVPPKRNTVLPGVSTRWISVSVRGSSEADQ